jgi:type II secretory pathway pseudopilin PulG
VRNAKRSSGFTYIGLLVAVAVIGIMLSASGTVWSFASRREKEVELLFIGHQIRDAIARYYAVNGPRYPRELQDLVNDDHGAEPRHFLRKIYRDPMTGAADWQIIRAADGGIMGVASNSNDKTIKRGNFDLVDSGFNDMERYSDWQFLFDPRLVRRRN